MQKSFNFYELLLNTTVSARKFRTAVDRNFKLHRNTWVELEFIKNELSNGLEYYAFNDSGKAQLVDAVQKYNAPDLLILLEKLKHLFIQYFIATPVTLLQDGVVIALVEQQAAAKDDDHSLQNIFLAQSIFLYDMYPQTWGARASFVVKHFLKKMPISGVLNHQNAIDAMFAYDESIDTKSVHNNLARLIYQQVKSQYTDAAVKDSLFFKKIVHEIKCQSKWLTFLLTGKSSWSQGDYYFWSSFFEDQTVDHSALKNKVFSAIELDPSVVLNAQSSTESLKQLMLKRSDIKWGAIDYFENINKAWEELWQEQKLQVSLTEIQKFGNHTLKNIWFQLLPLSKESEFNNKFTSTFGRSSRALFSKQTLQTKLASFFTYAIHKAIQKNDKLECLQDFPSYSVIGAVYKLADLCSVNVVKGFSGSIDVEEFFATCIGTINGWYDLAKIMPVQAQWNLMRWRQEQKEPTFFEFFENYQEYPFAYSPYDEKGGFSFNTYAELCKSYCVPVWGNLSKSFKRPTSRQMLHRTQTIEHLSDNIAATRLAYLYGADIAAAKKAVEQKMIGKKRTNYQLKKALHDAGQFYISVVKAETLKAWRPHLIKNEKMLKMAGNISDSLLPALGQSDEEIYQLLCSKQYQNVPEHLQKYMPHALENGWEQDIVDEFVKLSAKAKQSQLIPQVGFEHKNVYIKTLEKGNACALFIGELSGCCQHINYGAGEDAAVQSYTEEWCDVLAVYSKSSDKLVAQAFVWLDKDEKYIVIDSLESIHGASNTILKHDAFEAISKWISHMVQLGYTVGCSDTYYGVTRKLSTQLKKWHHSTTERTPKSYKRLIYTDTDYKIIAFGELKNER